MQIKWGTKMKQRESCSVAVVSGESPGRKGTER